MFGPKNLWMTGSKVVTYDNIGAGDSGIATTSAWGHVAAAGSLTIIYIAIESGYGQTLSSLTVNGVSAGFTNFAYQTLDNNSGYGSLYGYATNAAGSLTFQAAFNVSCYKNCQSISYNNARLATGFSYYNYGSNFLGAALNITPANGMMTFAGAASSSSGGTSFVAATGEGNVTQRMSRPASGSYLPMSGGDVTPAQASNGGQITFDISGSSAGAIIGTTLLPV